MRKWITFFIILAMAVSLVGCNEAWRKKFLRKKKESGKKPRIYQLKKYKKEPSEALYNKHYNYLITWLSELSENIGNNSKKDLRCAEEAIEQMKEVQGLLIPGKAAELDKHLNRLKEVRSAILGQDLDQANSDYVRRNVEREERFVRSEFYYGKIKNYMIKSFEEEDELKAKEVSLKEPGSKVE